MFVRDNPLPFGFNGHESLSSQDGPMDLQRPPLDDDGSSLFGGLGSSALGGMQREPVNNRLNTHTKEAQRFFQWALDMNVRWSMLNVETSTKANIVNVLTKVEDKYQVRG